MQGARGEKGNPRTGKRQGRKGIEGRKPDRTGKRQKRHSEPWHLV